MGGVYENKQNIKVGITVDTTLAGNLHNSVGNYKIEPLKASYFQLSNPSEITIPAGSLFGMVDVQLTQAFLDDTLAIAPKNVTLLCCSPEDNKFDDGFNSLRQFIGSGSRYSCYSSLDKTS